MLYHKAFFFTLYLLFYFVGLYILLLGFGVRFGEFLFGCIYIWCRGIYQKILVLLVIVEEVFLVFGDVKWVKWWCSLEVLVSAVD